MGLVVQVPVRTFKAVQKVARVRATKRSEAAGFLLRRAGSEVVSTAGPAHVGEDWCELSVDDPPSITRDQATRLLIAEGERVVADRIQRSDRPVAEEYDFTFGENEASVGFGERRFFDHPGTRKRDGVALGYVADRQPDYYTPAHQKLHQRVAARYRFKVEDPERWFIPSDGAVAVDAGAYVGYTAIGLHDSMGSDATVISTEMVLGNYWLLEKNIRANGLESRIHCHPYALAGARGTREVASRGSRGNLHTIAEMDSFSDARRTEVTTFTLSDLLDLHDVDQVDYLNVQVNGAELEVLQGLGPWFERVRRFYILCPYAGRGVATKEAVRRWLTEHGATIKRERRGLLVAEGSRA